MKKCGRQQDEVRAHNKCEKNVLSPHKYSDPNMENKDI